MGPSLSKRERYSQRMKRTTKLLPVSRTLFCRYSLRKISLALGIRYALISETTRSMRTRQEKRLMKGMSSLAALQATPEDTSEAREW